MAFAFDVVVDGTDFRGPYVHGRRGARFLYLSWGNLEPDGTWTMFRRAKLPLSTTSDAGLRATLELTDPRGGPRCASIPVEWVPETS